MEEGGTTPSSNNMFSVLNSVNDDDLHSIAQTCNICMGENSEEVYENINAIKLEERVRASLVEAKYKQMQEKILVETHRLEGEKLSLVCIDNKQCGMDGGFKFGLH